jgi:hypothetical protein
MSEKTQRRLRGEAFTGKGYGTLRYHLFKNARNRIETCIREEYYCEAIAISESVIADRLESRLSYLKGENVGFKTLGWLLGSLAKIESDDEIQRIIALLYAWGKKRNRALHELVKVEADESRDPWQTRLDNLEADARDGYELLKWIYTRIADLNPRHSSRAFPQPRRSFTRS